MYLKGAHFEKAALPHYPRSTRYSILTSWLLIILHDDINGNVVLDIIHDDDDDDNSDIDLLTNNALLMHCILLYLYYSINKGIKLINV